MSLKIRLARGGAKKRPYYRIVIADSRTARDGRFIERVGSYNPMVPRDHPDRVKLKEDRIKYWLDVGARPSDRVARFLGAAKLFEVPERRDQTKQHMPRPKTVERMKAAEEEKKAAEEAAAQAPAEEAAAPEAPAEEAPAEAAPAEDAAAAEAPAEEKPAEEAPAAEEKPAEDAAAAEEKQAEEKPAEEAAEGDGGEDVKKEDG